MPISLGNIEVVLSLLLLLALIIISVLGRKYYTLQYDNKKQSDSILNNIQDGVYCTDLDGNLIWCSPSAMKIFGVDSPENIKNVNVKDFYVDSTQREKLLCELRENGQVKNYEVLMQRRDGNQITISCNISYWRDSKGKIIGIEGVFRDISEQKQAKEALIESEEKYRSLIEGAAEAIFSVNYNGTFLFMNILAAQRLGGTPENFIGKTMWDVFPKQIADSQMDSIRKVMHNGEGISSETKTILKGKKFRYSTNLQPIRDSSGNISAVLGVAHDVTGLVETQQNLKNERDLVKSLLETANSLIICLDKYARIKVFNKEIEKVTGYSRDEVIGESWLDIFLPENHYHHKLDNFEDWVRKHPNDQMEGKIKTKSGELRTILWSNSTLFHPDSDEFTAIAIGHDITERKIIEQAQIESEIRFKESLKYSRDILYRLNLKTNTYDYMSDAVFDITGFTPEEMIEMGADGLNALVHPEDKHLHVNYRYKLINSDRGEQETYYTESRIKGKNGQYIWSGDSHALIRGPDGEPLYIIGCARDITNQKEAENALRENGRRYALATDAAKVGIWDWNLKTGKFYLDPIIKQILGYEDNEIPNDIEIWSDYIYPDDRKEVMEAAQAHIEGRTPEYVSEYRMLHKDGSIRWMATHGVAIRDSDGEVTQLIGTDVDITDRKQVEQALQQSELLNRTTIDTIDEAIHVVDLDMKIILMNKAFMQWCRKLDIGIDYIGKSIYELFPFLSENVRKEYQQVIDTGETVITEETAKVADQTIITETRKIPIKDNGNIARLVTIIRDITRQKQIESQRKARLELLNNLRHTRDIDFCLELGCRAIYEAGLFERAVLTMHSEKKEIINIGYVGLDEEIVKAALNAPVPGDDLLKKMTQKKYRISNSYFVPEESSISYTETDRYILQQKFDNRGNSSWRTGDELFVPIRGEQNKIDGWLSVDTPIDGNRPTLDVVIILEEIVDIVTQKIREIRTVERLRQERKALLQSEAFNKAIIKYSPMGVSVRSNTGKLLSANDAWINIWGHTQEEMSDFITRERAELKFDYCDEYLGRWLPALERVYKKGGYLHVPDVQVTNPKRKDPLYVSQHFYAIKDTSGNVDRVVILTEDITERKIAEYKIKVINIEKLNQAKRIAGTFAHEIRNALFPATASLNRIKLNSRTDSNNSEELKKYSSIAEQSITRAANITGLISSYTKLDTERMPERVNLNEIVLELLNNNQLRLLENNVVVNTSGGNNCLVKSNKRQLLLVFNNLLLNSIDALTEKGKKNEEKNRKININWSSNDSGYNISFQDNGCGIQSEYLGRVFEPFFSQKSESGGTGLGLAMSKRIIGMYGGTISVNSVLGTGTTFNLNIKNYKADSVDKIDNLE